LSPINPFPKGRSFGQVYGFAYSYLLLVPAGDAPESVWPVVLFLHGAGELTAVAIFDRTRSGCILLPNKNGAKWPRLLGGRMQLLLVFQAVPALAVWGEPFSTLLFLWELIMQTDWFFGKSRVHTSPTRTSSSCC
jgi:hypothetical protein